MVQTFATNSAGDIYIGDGGNLAIFSNLQAVLAACKTASLAQLGEEVLTTTQGLPNFQAIWVGSPNYALYQSYLRNTLLAVPGVLEVKSISMFVKENVLNYTATIVTQFGTGEITNG